MRVTATRGGVTSSSGAFTVTLAPSISATPASFTFSLPQGGTTIGTLTLGNTGGGSLVWSIATGAFVLGEIFQGPEFAGNGEIVEDKNAPRPPDPAATYTTPRESSDPPPSAAPPPLITVLANLNANKGLVRAAIPNRFAFTDGVTGNNISDGGNDMYDGGNFLGASITPASYLNYSDNLIAASTLLGTGGQYFTRKFDGLFVLAADVNALTYFEIVGNLGADGGGSTDTAVLSVVRDGTTWRGFVKRVCNAGDPSVNHILIVPANGTVTHEASTDTNNDYHRVTNLTGVTRIYHLLYAGTAGAYIDNTAALAIMTAFLDALAAPDWLTPNPVTGTIAGGASQNITLTFATGTLAPGNYPRTLLVISNDPVRPQVSVPVMLTVQNVPNLTVTPATGLTSAGLRGGPFTPASQTYVLSNPGNAPLVWTAAKTATWLDLSATGSSLASGASVNVVASLNAAANALAAGAFTGTITFTNTTNGIGNTTRPLALTVSAFGVLSVTPAANPDASGPFGGPFTPSGQSYTLTNPGDAVLNWTAAKSAAWLNLSATSGTLAPGASTTVTATIVAPALDPGSYSDTVTFTNTTNIAAATQRAPSRSSSRCPRQSPLPNRLRPGAPATPSRGTQCPEPVHMRCKPRPTPLSPRPSAAAGSRAPATPSPG